MPLRIILCEEVPSDLSFRPIFRPFIAKNFRNVALLLGIFLGLIKAQEKSQKYVSCSDFY